MKDIQVGDVVQINPESDETFGGSYLEVEEVKCWGVIGFVHGLDRGNAYYRATWEQIERIGRAYWVFDPYQSA